MKNSTSVSIIFSLFVFTLIIISSCNSTSTTKENIDNTKETSSIQIENKKLLRHVVLFNFNEKASEEIVTEIEQKFAKLKDKISEIHSFEWGTNNSPEGLDKGLTHCFLVTFLSEKDRETYLPHPSHQEFVEFIGPYVEDVTVVDYWVKK